jgi:hypothetical protein
MRLEHVDLPLASISNIFYIGLNADLKKYTGKCVYIAMTNITEWSKQYFCIPRNHRADQKCRKR